MIKCKSSIQFHFHIYYVYIHVRIILLQSELSHIFSYSQPQLTTNENSELASSIPPSRATFN